MGSTRVARRAGLEQAARATTASSRLSDAKIDHMKQASVRDLRYQFPRVEALLRAGEEIEITKRRRVIARLVPPAAPVAVVKPDFAGRMRSIFGRKRMATTAAEMIADDRDRY